MVLPNSKTQQEKVSYLRDTDMHDNLHVTKDTTYPPQKIALDLLKQVS